MAPMSNLPRTPSQPLEPDEVPDTDPGPPEEVENPGDPGPNTWTPGEAPTVPLIPPGGA